MEIDGESLSLKPEVCARLLPGMRSNALGAQVLPSDAGGPISLIRSGAALGQCSEHCFRSGASLPTCKGWATIQDSPECDHLWSSKCSDHHSRRSDKLRKVAAGLSEVRQTLVKELLAFKPAVIRGNAGEIACIAGTVGGSKGTDSTLSTESCEPLAKELAAALGCTVAVSGDVDFVRSACLRCCECVLFLSAPQALS